MNYTRVKQAVLSLALMAVVLGSPAASIAQVTETSPGRITGGGGIGFMGATPDGTAFALNGYVDQFFARYFSVGPLAQFALTGNMTLFGLSGQAKYWFDIPESGNRAKLVIQAGLGFVHADRLNSDTSFLIPLGVGLDYAVNPSLAMTANFILNFMDLDTGNGKDAHLVPALMFGVRF